MGNKKEINENRRRINKLTGAGILAAATGAIGGTIAWVDARTNPGDTGREIYRDSYTGEEFRDVRDCLEEDEIRGLGNKIDELLDSDEGRNLKEVEFIYHQKGSSEDTGSSLRYTIELQGGEEHRSPWDETENQYIKPLAEAKQSSDISGYAEDNC